MLDVNGTLESFEYQDLSCNPPVVTCSLRVDGDCSSDTKVVIVQDPGSQGKFLDCHKTGQGKFQGPNMVASFGLKFTFKGHFKILKGTK